MPIEDFQQPWGSAAFNVAVPEEPTVLKKVTKLTSAQILALHTTPIELVPAPASDEAIALVAIFASAVPPPAGAVGYSGDDPKIIYTGEDYAGGENTLGFRSTADAWLSYVGSLGGTSDTGATVRGRALKLLANSASPLINGNLAVEVTVLYNVV